jgi:hypothetical protein
LFAGIGTSGRPNGELSAQAGKAARKHKPNNLTGCFIAVILQGLAGYYRAIATGGYAKKECFIKNAAYASYTACCCDK